jgi:helix-turn-helix protein
MSNHKLTQRDRLLRLLAEAKGAWVPLPAILALNIAQFGARILELRRAGHIIENHTEKEKLGYGGIHSWYRLVPKASQQVLFER